MKFLFFVGGWNFGGMETAHLSLMKGLKALGHQPVAIVCRWTDGIVPELLEQAGIPYHQVRLGRIYLRNPYWTWHTHVVADGGRARVAAEFTIEKMATRFLAALD